MYRLAFMLCIGWPWFKQLLCKEGVILLKIGRMNKLFVIMGMVHFFLDQAIYVDTYINNKLVEAIIVW